MLRLLAPCRRDIDNTAMAVDDKGVVLAVIISNVWWDLVPEAEPEDWIVV